MKIFWIVVFFLLSIGLVLAHEFWLQPDRFFVKPGESVTLQVLVGEGFRGERSEGKKNRIVQYRHHSSGTTADLSPALTGDTYGSVAIPLTKPGTHLFAFANTPKFLAMRADSFLLYLEEDGLDSVMAYRKTHGRSGQNSRELYQRCVKTLVQVGAQPDGTFAKKTGMPLEIFPTQNPYAQHPGQSAEFTVLFNEKPIAGALVRYWNRSGTGPLTEQKQRSDRQGRVRFTLRAGQNMVSLVHMLPNGDTTVADWHSYWGSLTFGCR